MMHAVPNLRFIATLGLVVLAVILVLPLRSAQAAAISVACGAKNLVNAIENANNSGGADTLELTPDCVYTLKSINNTDPSYGPNGLPVITDDLVIHGNGATIVRKNAPQFRLIQLSQGIALSLNVLTLQAGQTPGDGGAVLNPGGTLNLDDVILTENSAGGKGGAVDNDNFGTLNVADVTLSSNHATYGGGIYSFGPHTLVRTAFLNNTGTYGAGFYVDGGQGTLMDSRFVENVASGSGGAFVLYSPVEFTLQRTLFEANQGTGGGAIYNGGSKLVITDSTFDANIGTYGGAIYAAEPLDLVNSALSRNSAGVQGGAIYHTFGDLNISNSTLYDNRSTNDGGALYNAGNLATLINSTIAGNTANANGGSIFNTGDYQGTVVLANTIVANNTAGGNCHNEGTLTDDGNNLRWPDTDLSCVGSFGDPHLGAFAPNGGPTRTMALGVGSAAIDAGNDTKCALTLVNNVDQRGLSRPQGAHCDIGAFEAGPATDLSISDSAAPDPVELNSNLTFSIYVQNHGPGTAQNLVFDTQVPDNTTFQSFAGAGWSCTTPAPSGTGAIHCTRNSLDPSTGVDLALTVHTNSALPAGVILSNTATLSTDTIDLGPGPNTATANACAGMPAKPTLRSPAKGANVKKKALLDWDRAICGSTYTVIVRQDSKKGAVFQEKPGLTVTQFKTKSLVSGKTYFWRVSACNEIGCNASAWSSFNAK